MTRANEAKGRPRYEPGPDDPAPYYNEKISRMFGEAADLLHAQGANPFRVRAWRRAAATLLRLQRDVTVIARKEGRRGLTALPDIGEGIATAILEIAATGQWSLLDRLRGQQDPEALFQTIPTIGPKLAARIHDELHIDSLEGLEAAAHDGRLERIHGVGPRRAALVRSVLGQRLARKRPHLQAADADVPEVTVLLEVDEEYRQKAAQNALPRIAPRRFNPDGKAWLPILHVTKGRWHFTALFSNTAQAHRLKRTRDWVVIYFYDGDHHEGQCTVVTERGRTPLRGQRVVRGREGECYLSQQHRPRSA